MLRVMEIPNMNKMLISNTGKTYKEQHKQCEIFA